jgi:hypothetical protein
MAIKGTEMLRDIVRILLLAAAVVSIQTGCWTSRHIVTYERVTAVTPADAVITTAPPPPRQEIIGPPPTSEHVWVTGYWAWDGHQYVWIAGHWELRPREGVAWVAGTWQHVGKGWVWTPGHWE